jgi:hypothetical protein
MEKQRDAKGRYLAGPGGPKRRSGGKWVDSFGAGTTGVEADGDAGAAPRPAHCRLYTLERMAMAMPAVVMSLVGMATKGSVPHIKLLIQISGLDKADVVPAKRMKREKNLEEILKEAWENDVAEKAKREAARAVPAVLPVTRPVETAGFSGLDGGPV